MFVPDLFRSFLPRLNPIGFGAADFIELFLALFLTCAIFARAPIQRFAQNLARRTALCMVLLALLPVMLRVALLPNHPVPTAAIYDEFSHLLEADTLRHFRFANPPHPMHRFFETAFVLQEPTYSSIYPPGQGLILAAGRAVSGSPWTGVLIATAAFCALVYWMLLAWVPPLWALAGGLLCVIEFGPLNPWMNSYWGGSLAACTGCLVFGALPRLRQRASARDAALLGAGLSLHILTRPYESLFLLLAVALYFVMPRNWLPRRDLRLLCIPGLLVAAALLISLVQNRQVTGDWTTLPYQLSQYQYGVPSALTFQPNPLPHRVLTPEQALNYAMQLSFHGKNTDTLASYLLRLEYRVRYYRFYFLAPLYIALIGWLLHLRSPDWLWVSGVALLFALGTNFFPAFQFHYIAGIVDLFLLMCVMGLRRLALLGSSGREIAAVVLLFCFAHFVFWYSLHVFENAPWSIALRDYAVWDGLNHLSPERRILVSRELAAMPGAQLVFVHYSAQHIFQDEWVYNEADIDHARVVWARDLGPENEYLLRYYPHRAAWMLEPDASPPRLTPYLKEPAPEPGAPLNGPPTTVSTKAPEAKRPVQQPKLRFEDVK